MQDISLCLYTICSRTTAPQPWLSCTEEFSLRWLLYDASTEGVPNMVCLHSGGVESLMAHHTLPLCVLIISGLSLTCKRSFIWTTLWRFTRTRQYRRYKGARIRDILSAMRGRGSRWTEAINSVHVASVITVCQSPKCHSLESRYKNAQLLHVFVPFPSLPDHIIFLSHTDSARNPALLQILVAPTPLLLLLLYLQYSFDFRSH